MLTDNTRFMRLDVRRSVACLADYGAGRCMGNDMATITGSARRAILLQFQELIESCRASGFDYHKWFFGEREPTEPEILAQIKVCREAARRAFLALSALASRAELDFGGPAECADQKPDSQIPPAWLADLRDPKH